MREALDPTVSRAARAALGGSPDLSDSLFVEAVRKAANESKGKAYTYDETISLLNNTFKDVPPPSVAPPASLSYPTNVGTAPSNPLDTGVEQWFSANGARDSRTAKTLLQKLKADYGDDATATALISNLMSAAHRGKAGQMDFGDYWRRMEGIKGLWESERSGPFGVFERSNSLVNSFKNMGLDLGSPDLDPKAVFGIPAWNMAPDVGSAVKSVMDQFSGSAAEQNLPGPVADAYKFAGKLGHVTLRNSVDRVFLAGNAAMANGGLQAMAGLVQAPLYSTDESSTVKALQNIGRAGKAFAHAVIMSPDDVAEKYASPEAVIKMASDEDEGVRALMDWQFGQELPSPVKDAVLALTTSFGLDEASKFQPARAAAKLGMSLIDPFFIATKGLSAVRAAGRAAGYEDAMAKLIRRGVGSAAAVDGFNRGVEAFPHIGEAFKEAADMPDLAALNQHADILQGMAGQVPEILNLPAYYDADALAKAIANTGSMGGKGKARLMLEAEAALKMDQAGQVGLMEKRAQIAKMLPPEARGALAAMKRTGAQWQGKGPPMATYLDDMMEKTNAHLAKLGYDEAGIEDFWRQTDRYWQVRQAAGKAAKMGAAETVAKDLP